jgi:hypothetical protein
MTSLVSLAAAALLAPPSAPNPVALGAPVAPGADAPHGLYVEARTASVFAGACHYNGELVTAGREALLAWSFEGGSHAGVDLAGLELAALVWSDRNLKLGGERSSVLLLPSDATDAERAALAGWAAERAGASLGTIAAAHASELEVEIADGAAAARSFRVHAGATIELAGGELPDRACCRMPFDVWYEPLFDVAERRVGLVDEFRVGEGALGLVWSRPGENSAFVGTFGGTSGAQLR